MKYYHITRSSNIPSIMRKGLRPGSARGLSEILRKGPKSSEEYNFLKYDKSRGLFLADDLETMGSFAGSLRYAIKKPTKFSILEVDIPKGVELLDDTDAFGHYQDLPGAWVTYQGSIPPSRVKVLGNLVVRPKRTPDYLLPEGISSILEQGNLGGEALASWEFGSSKETKRAKDIVKELPKSSRYRSYLESRIEEEEEENDSD